MISFVVPGTPVGKGRPRFAKRGNFVTTYTPEKTASYENLVKLSAHEAMNGKKQCSDSVGCTIICEVMPPASWSKKKRMAAICGDIRPTTKPDLDNVAKAILDAMNGIVFDDDKQVVELIVSKRYSETPMTTVKVFPL